MKYLYIPLVIAAIILCAYRVGIYNGRQKCMADVASDAVVTQQQIINKIGEIHAETYHTGAADIRRVLRAKYTIAE